MLKYIKAMKAIIGDILNYTVSLPKRKEAELKALKLRYQVANNIPQLSIHEYIMQCSYIVDKAINIKSVEEK